ncbi:chemotaxis protein methyltransferase CheR [Paenibacillus phyllosphaerae]|uniref:protein-glutamate O-methyltransferase n=1 Tax=Paenibacillus phyllosphaerae TaxID=274593 RepID=A0A7W5AX09_9BACL|nr:protein-glutamate O-methyltransferase CheR [Paenibacillus phyllosphaerae]MBB3109816.1 chemotaxis protein methyltransferase CheR [Paenibacillus phyllosphaerae]
MAAITDQEFKQLADYVKAHYGIHLKDEKRPLVLGRLQHVLTEKGFATFTEYMKYVTSDRTGAAARGLVDKITTNHTFFMRETEHFHFFKSQVLPYLVKTVKEKDLRIWSAGCSSGEEPYTLAMIIDEFFGAQKPQWDTKVLATDISSRVLETAQKGIYSLESIQTIPAGWKSGYFRKLNAEQAVVDSKLQREVVFRKFNLMDPVFPFKRKFHTIFCRNVMIYFDGPTKNNLVNKYYEMMEPGGYLFIGHSESIDRNESPFQYVRPAIYRKPF